MSRPMYDVACLKCAVGPGEHCRSLTTDRVTDTHSVRLDHQMAYRQKLIMERQSR